MFPLYSCSSVLSWNCLRKLFLSLKSSVSIMKCDFKSFLLFLCVRVFRPHCAERIVFWWCQADLVSVTYVRAFAACYLVICDVSWSYCIDCGLSLLRACVSLFLEQLIFPGGIWVGRDIAQGQLWDAKRNTEGSFPRFLLNSCELSVLDGSLGADVLVFPVLTVMSALLGAQISSGGVWVWKTVAQEHLLELLHRISQFIYFYWLL